jgi:hypothetical protein
MFITWLAKISALLFNDFRLKFGEQRTGFP